jgi:hypothetical protein
MRTTAACRTGFVEPKRPTQQSREETLCLHLDVTICDFYWRAEVSFPYSFLSSQACGGIRGVFPFSFGFVCTWNSKHAYYKQDYVKKNAIYFTQPSRYVEKTAF